MQMTGRRGVVWRTPDITADGLKIFGCVIMLVQAIGITMIGKGLIHLDHFTQAGLNEALAKDSDLMVLAGIASAMQIIGGLAVPVFAYLLVEGFRYTSDYRRYLLAMAVFALISEVPYDLASSQRFVDFSSQNALVTMCICLLMLYFLRMLEDRSGAAGHILRCVIVFCAVLWVTLLRAQYGLCVVLLTADFYLFYRRNVLKVILGVIVSLLYVTGPIAFYLLWCYNEKREDKIPKYAYYAFYPLHLLVCGLAVKYFL